MAEIVIKCDQVRYESEEKARESIRSLSPEMRSYLLRYGPILLVYCSTCSSFHTRSYSIRGQWQSVEEHLKDYKAVEPGIIVRQKFKSST